MASADLNTTTATQVLIEGEDNNNNNNNHNNHNNNMMATRLTFDLSQLFTGVEPWDPLSAGQAYIYIHIYK